MERTLAHRVSRAGSGLPPAEGAARPGPASKVWRLCSCPGHVCTPVRQLAGELRVERLKLDFSVSLDEEHVDLTATCDGRTFVLGDRGHNYLLLTLARRRLADRAAGLPETSCGWLDLEGLQHDPTLTPPRLNVDVFRIRRQFAALGVLDAQAIIQRRTHSRRLRIGTGHLRVAQL